VLKRITLNPLDFLQAGYLGWLAAKAADAGDAEVRKRRFYVIADFAPAIDD